MPKIPFTVRSRVNAKGEVHDPARPFEIGSWRPDCRGLDRKRRWSGKPDPSAISTSAIGERCLDSHGWPKIAACGSLSSRSADALNTNVQHRCPNAVYQAADQVLPGPSGRSAARRGVVACNIFLAFRVASSRRKRLLISGANRLNPAQHDAAPSFQLIAARFSVCDKVLNLTWEARVQEPDDSKIYKFARSSK